MNDDEARVVLGRAAWMPDGLGSDDHPPPEAAYAFYALQDACGHRQAPLSKGTLAGHVIECPLHFAQFDVRTGKLLTGPTAADVPTYEVRVEGDTVYVKR